MLLFYCRNFKGATPRHIVPADSSAEANKMLYILHAVGAKRCYEDTAGCSQGCAYNGTFDGVSPPPPPVGCTRDALDQMLFTYAMDLASNRDSKEKYAFIQG